jgi:hypothetical protein
MRYIVLRTITVGSAIQIEALTSLLRKASGMEAAWIKFEEASTNCLEPENCDLLSFDEEERDEMEDSLELWGFGDTVSLIGVEFLGTVESTGDIEPVISSVDNES